MKTTLRISGSDNSFIVNEPSGTITLFETSDGTYDDIERFDLKENRGYWNREVFPEHGLDILDVGYWTKDGLYVPAESDWRKELILADYRKP